VVIALVSVIGLEGCVPWRFSYERIQAPQAVNATMRLEAVLRDSHGIGSPDSRPVADHLRLPSDFGQLQGATRRGHPVWYGFYSAP
jgi:hypothetical protein